MHSWTFSMAPRPWSNRARQIRGNYWVGLRQQGTAETDQGWFVMNGRIPETFNATLWGPGKLTASYNIRLCDLSNHMNFEFDNLQANRTIMTVKIAQTWA